MKFAKIIDFTHNGAEHQVVVMKVPSDEPETDHAVRISTSMGPILFEITAGVGSEADQQKLFDGYGLDQCKVFIDDAQKFLNGNFEQ